MILVSLLCYYCCKCGEIFGPKNYVRTIWSSSFFFLALEVLKYILCLFIWFICYCLDVGDGRYCIWHLISHFYVMIMIHALIFIHVFKKDCFHTHNFSKLVLIVVLPLGSLDKHVLKHYWDLLCSWFFTYSISTSSLSYYNDLATCFYSIMMEHIRY